MIGGLTYNFLPFMVLPIYVAIEKIDPGLVDAARDLYSNTWRAFRKIVFPMSLPGVFAGSLLVFIPAAGDFVNAYYLGNAQTTMIGNVVQDQFLVQGDYPGRGRALVRVHGDRDGARHRVRRASSAPRTRRERGRGQPVTVTSPAAASAGSLVNLVAAFGLALPVRADLRDRRVQLQRARRVASTRSGSSSRSTTGCTRSPTEPLVDALHAEPAHRVHLDGDRDDPRHVRRDRARALPHPGRRAGQLPARPAAHGARDRARRVAAHAVHPARRCCCSTTTSRSARRRSSSPTSCSCVSYVAITVRARVRGIDWTLEDAAMDLGASPTRTFWKVTLPLITPGILAAALLSFALSIDDFIITYFVSGPDTTTFPVRIFNQSRTATPPQINVLVDDDPVRQRHRSRGGDCVRRVPRAPLIGTDVERTTAIVTGAASGIGAATVVALQRAGARVASLDLVESTRRPISRSSPTSRTRRRWSRASLAVDDLGRLDVAVVNAGVGGMSPCWR